ncbi:MAG TPA: PAS domain S-box protein [Herpetosiphonaceae bacterium]|nr:PAS domain S-box protein [Herpetosiphonaceae bacterium]
MTADSLPPEQHIDQLQQRVADLERQLELAHQNEIALRDESRRFRALLESSPDAIVFYDNEGKTQYINPSFTRIFGWTSEDLVGKRIDFVPEDSVAETQAAIRELFSGASKSTSFGARRFTKTGQIVDVEINAALAIARDGTTRGMIVSLRDVTAQKRTEVERLELQEELLRIQAAALAELSTPLIPISDEIVVMPLIGTIDANRIGQMIDKLAHDLTVTRARAVILDITGVPVVDTHVASGLIQATQVLRLLGSQVIITGVRPEVAQTLVTIGVVLDEIVTRSTLQSGIGYAMQQKAR